MFAILNIVINLAILFFFKYYDFFIESFCGLLNSLGIDANWSLLHLILPVGISFYTFQALSYTIDVYRGKMQATHDVMAFLAFLSFFPQLVAGPIERASSLLPQFLRKRGFEYADAVDGLRQILWGLFKKVVVADNCALIVNDIFSCYRDHTGIELFLAAILFSFQIYGDFSGYSDIAIGTAKLFGIKLTRNFNVPYFSRNIAEFWKRWHITLNTWFVDYVYIPLGGSRCAKWKVIRNTFVIFLLSGLWHGANWTFICWGLFHALLFVPLLVLGKSKQGKDVVAESRFLPTVKEVIQMSVTFLLVVLGWIIFRAESIAQLQDYMTYMVTGHWLMVPTFGKTAFLYALVMIAIEWIHRKKDHGLQLCVSRIPVWGRFLIYYAIVAAIVFCRGAESQFIYFQF